MDLGFLTYRELLSQRRIAQRALRQNRQITRTQSLIDRIENELERRRHDRFERAAAHLPVIYRGVKNINI